jgi:hypothetical protein
MYTITIMTTMTTTFFYLVNRYIQIYLLSLLFIPFTTLCWLVHTNPVITYSDRLKLRTKFHNYGKIIKYVFEKYNKFNIINKYLFPLLLAALECVVGFTHGLINLLDVNPNDCVLERFQNGVEPNDMHDNANFAVSELDVLESDVLEPDVLESVEQEPDALEPDILEPDILEPDILEPDILEPDVLESVEQEPDALEPDILEPDILEPDILEPDVLESDVLESVEQEPDEQEPVIQELVIQELAIQELAIQELAIQEPVIQALAIQEPVIQEPVIQTSIYNKKRSVHQNNRDNSDKFERRGRDVPNNRLQSNKPTEKIQNTMSKLPASNTTDKKKRIVIRRTNGVAVKNSTLNATH